MARKNLFSIAEADTGRRPYEPLSPAEAASPALRGAETASKQRQQYREGKRAVMFFLPEEAFSQMHVLLARQGRKKVQTLMEELVDDWFRRENAPRLLR